MRRTTSNVLAAIVCASGLVGLGPDRPCHGGGLLPLRFDPDGATFLGVNGSLNYHASSGEFGGVARALSLSSPHLPGPGYLTLSGEMTYDLFVNQDGTFRKDGSGFDLVGSVSIDGTTIDGTLLTGQVNDFGSDGVVPPTWRANATFDTTGGLLTQPVQLPDGTTLSALFTPGSLQGINLDVEHSLSGTLGDYTADFSGNKLKGQGGPLAVSEPPSWLLGILALVVLSLIRRVRAHAALA